MRMNLPLGRMMYQIRFNQGIWSISAASSSAFGTEPSAASVIRIMNGVHIQTSTAIVAPKARSLLPRKSNRWPTSFSAKKLTMPNVGSYIRR